MTTPLGAAAAGTAQATVDNIATLDAAYAAVTRRLADTQATNADLLIVQGNLNNQIGTLTAKVTDLETQLAALQPTPTPPPFGASLSALSGETWAQAVARTEKALGPLPVLRVYDSANGATWLYNKLHDNGLLDGRRKICASIKHIDVGLPLLVSAVDYITIDHEPDQGYDKTGPRVTPTDLAPLLKQVRDVIYTNGRLGKCKLMLILTGTNYAPRLKAYMDAIGNGVVNVLGVDPYASKGTAAQLVGPLLTAAAAYNLPVAVTEIGMTTATPDATVAAFVASLKDLAGKVEFVTWFNQHGSAALGNRLDNVTTLAQEFRGIAT